MSKHNKSPLSGIGPHPHKVHPPTPSAAVAEAAGQLVGVGPLPVVPIKDAVAEEIKPELHSVQDLKAVNPLPHEAPDPVAVALAARLTEEIKKREASQSSEVISIGRDEIAAFITEDGKTTKIASNVRVPIPTQNITILFAFHIIDEGVITQEQTFANMAEANAFLEVARREGIMFNTKARPESTWYPVHSIKKIVSKPILKERPNQTV